MAKRAKWGREEEEREKEGGRRGGGGEGEEEEEEGRERRRKKDERASPVYSPGLSSATPAACTPSTGLYLWHSALCN